MRQATRAMRIAGYAAMLIAAAVVLAPAFSLAGSAPTLPTPPNGAPAVSTPATPTAPPQQPLAASPAQGLPAQSATPRDRYSGQPINRLSAPAPAGAKPSATAPSSGYSFDAPRVGGALLAVLALIFVLRWISHQIFPSTAAGRATKSIRVLSRSVIGPKQQIMLVQVGKRVIVVGDSGQQLTALSEITDPDEVTTVLGDVHADRTPAVSNPFGKLFGRAKGDFVDDAADAKPPGDLPDAADADETFTGHRDGAPEDPSLSLTRDELSGLSEKIRGLSQQLGRR